jgi:hypothetical protein
LTVWSGGALMLAMINAVAATVGAIPLGVGSAARTILVQLHPLDPL